MRKYRVTAFYPTYPGLHPLDDRPREEFVAVEAGSEAQAALEAVIQGWLPVEFAVRRTGESVAVYWHPGIYGTNRLPKVVDSSPSEVVLGFGERHDAHTLTISVWPDDDLELA